MFSRRAFLAVGAACPLAARAQQSDYPAKAIRLVVPYSAGGIVDNFARPLAQQMSEQLGQQVVIENRAGASGMVGASVVAAAPADGYTLLCTTSSHYLTPLLTKSPTYDPVKDFTPIVLAARAPVVVVVHVSLPVGNLAELVALSKKTPQGLDYVTAGTGTQQHLTGEMIALRTQANLVHVAYKGGSQALTDLVGGRINVGILGLSTVLPFIQAGKLKALAVTDSHRSASYPDIPTFGESGIQGLVMPDTSVGLLGPAGLPAPVVSRIDTEARKAMETPMVRSALKAAGYEATPVPASEFGPLSAKIYAMYQRMTKEANLKID
ncbi:Tripartite tricarboxylate transporter family receptor [Pigmentiphaga humi]|uniref:Tripartite tricarboxylate transporter family receptor n=1 Tax=Pigmentiphaga humi TaxID=2478468 RepID=A0A3P4B692_9BURK|nr:tripartite tricarboxylate transporter substrate binding protein [Pigmentiphaga humi]VCU71046.1 Tripartite tricarboxylate transporter family receptor [Pigmentiphaga humi]